MNKKILILTLILTTAILVTVFTIRLFAIEDNWICEEGIWVKHGNPSAAMPKEQCSKLK